MKGINDDSENSALAGQSVFDIIKADHKNVMALFGQIEASVDQERVYLIEKCVQELLLHAIAEEETLYRKLRVIDHFHQDILTAEVEQSLIERLANEIMSSSPDDELCDARLIVLREFVEHHFFEEEQQLLPAAQGLIDTSTAISMGQEMLTRKAALEADGLQAYAGELEELLGEDEDSFSPARDGGRASPAVEADASDDGFDKVTR